MNNEYDFSQGKRGAILPAPPGKKQITIRLDDDVLEWFRAQVNAAGGGNYQTLINQALREHVASRQESIQAMFAVRQIDHVEVFVPDRDEAARWFEQVLGLSILVEHQDWAVEGGPLMISSDGGNTKVALFEGKSRGTRPTAGHHRLAFRVDGTGFLTFLARTRDGRVYDDDLTPIPVLDPVDHAKSWSVYFCDPWGNRYEVTTYDYEFVSKNLAKGT